MGIKTSEVSGSVSKDKSIHLTLTHDILKCCFDVAQELRSGFLESVYQNALLIGLLVNFGNRKLQYKRVYHPSTP